MPKIKSERQSTRRAAVMAEPISSPISSPISNSDSSPISSPPADKKKKRATKKADTDIVLDHYTYTFTHLADSKAIIAYYKTNRAPDETDTDVADRIKRCPNMFILWRFCFLRGSEQLTLYTATGKIEKPTQMLKSKVAGEVWHKLNKDKQDQYQEAYNTLKEELGQGKGTGYKYKPRKSEQVKAEKEELKARKKEARALATQRKAQEEEAEAAAFGMTVKDYKKHVREEAQAQLRAQADGLGMTVEAFNECKKIDLGRIAIAAAASPAAFAQEGSATPALTPDTSLISNNSFSTFEYSSSDSNTFSDSSYSPAGYDSFASSGSEFSPFYSSSPVANSSPIGYHHQQQFVGPAYAAPPSHSNATFEQQPEQFAPQWANAGAPFYPGAESHELAQNDGNVFDQAFVASHPDIDQLLAEVFKNGKDGNNEYNDGAAAAPGEFEDDAFAFVNDMLGMPEAASDAFQYGPENWIENTAASDDLYPCANFNDFSVEAALEDAPAESIAREFRPLTSCRGHRVESHFEYAMKQLQQAPTFEHQPMAPSSHADLGVGPSTGSKRARSPSGPVSQPKRVKHAILYESARLPTAFRDDQANSMTAGPSTFPQATNASYQAAAQWNMVQQSTYNTNVHIGASAEASTSYLTSANTPRQVSQFFNENTTGFGNANQWPAQSAEYNRMPSWANVEVVTQSRAPSATFSEMLEQISLSALAREERANLS